MIMWFPLKTQCTFLERHYREAYTKGKCFDWLILFFYIVMTYHLFYISKWNKTLLRTIISIRFHSMNTNIFHFNKYLILGIPSRQANYGNNQLLNNGFNFPCLVIARSSVILSPNDNLLFIRWSWTSFQTQYTGWKAASSFMYYIFFFILLVSLPLIRIRSINVMED